nr:uncharacterized protein LOC129261854 [Lytechinus pictus]
MTMSKSYLQGNHNRNSNHIPDPNVGLLWDVVARPLKVLMILFGLYHERTTRGNDHESSVKDKMLCYILKMYHTVIVLFLWYNFLRAVVSFWLTKTTGLLYDNVAICVWGFLVAANDTIFLKICHKGDIVRLIENQSTICFNFPKNGRLTKNHINPSWLKFRTFALAGAAVGFCAICVCVVPMLFFIYGTKESSFSYKLLCLPWHTDVACGFSSAYAVYGTASWILPMVFIAFICRILNGQLAQLTHDFTDTFGHGKNSEAKLLESFRRKFNLLCRSVELADAILSPLYATSYCANISIAIFLLYQIWNRFSDAELFYVLINLFWVVGNLINIGLISYYAVTVHEKVNFNFSYFYCS